MLIGTIYTLTAYIFRNVFFFSNSLKCNKIEYINFKHMYFTALCIFIALEGLNIKVSQIGHRCHVTTFTHLCHFLLEGEREPRASKGERTRPV